MFIYILCSIIEFIFPFSFYFGVAKRRRITFFLSCHGVALRSLIPYPSYQSLKFFCNANVLIRNFFCNTPIYRSPHLRWLTKNPLLLNESEIPIRSGIIRGVSPPSAVPIISGRRTGVARNLYKSVVYIFLLDK